MSTRIILVHYPSPDCPDHLLGLMAERVIETTSLSKEDMSPSGVKVKKAPFLGKIAQDQNGILQIIQIEQILPADLKETLYKSTAEADH